jgi:hypothetical protein
MKIKDILNEKEEDWKQNSPDFKTKQVGFDPDTGQFSWDVEYTPMVSLDNHIMDAAEDFKKVTRKFPQDEKLEKLYKVFSGFKKAFRTHMNRKYAK